MFTRSFRYFIFFFAPFLSLFPFLLQILYPESDKLGTSSPLSPTLECDTSSGSRKDK